jgi:hypothetical protein
LLHLLIDEFHFHASLVPEVVGASPMSHENQHRHEQRHEKKILSDHDALLL